MTIKSREARLSKTATLDEYFGWLCDLVHVVQPYVSYNLLAEALHNKEFRWFVPNDDNRAFDGKALRERFCDEMGIMYVHDYFIEECSMLELIIGLAYRCEFIMADENGNLDMEGWFWKFISNADLDRFTDVPYYDLWEGEAVDDILNTIIDRTYGYNGDGGLFPLKCPRKDQRKVELWYQMSEYLMENYYIEDDIV